MIEEHRHAGIRGVWRRVGRRGFSLLLLLLLLGSPAALAQDPPQQVVEEEAPFAFFTTTPQTGPTGATFVFDASASEPSPGAVDLAYFWDLGNGTFAPGAVRANSSYGQVGAFVIRLRVVDDLGREGLVAQTILVTGARPTSYFTVRTEIVGLETRVTVNATFSSPSRGASEIVRYEWRFGDDQDAGFVEGNVTEERVYRDASVYRITLRVTDDEGRQATTTIPVVVGDTFWLRMLRVWDERDAFLRGAQLTLQLALIAVTAGLVLALALALMRLSRFAIVSWPATAVIEVIRGTPLLVQILIAWLVLPHVGLPLSLFWSGAVALIVNTAAYMAEVIRAGIQAIPSGQMEAALAMGMTRTQAMRFVVLPQAFRLVIPPMGNEFIILLKDTSLVSVIGVVELTQVGRIFSARTFLVLETWLGVALIYFIMTYSLSRVLMHFEKKLRIPGLGLEGGGH